MGWKGKNGSWNFFVAVLSSLSDISCVFSRVLGSKQQAMLPVQHPDLSPVSLNFIFLNLWLPTPHTHPLTYPIHPHGCAHSQFIVQITPDLPISMNTPSSLWFMAGLTRLREGLFQLILKKMPLRIPQISAQLHHFYP